MLAHRWTATLGTAAAVVVGAPPAHTPRAVAPPHDVTVVATDYALALPDTLAAGPTQFRVDNRGRELHHVMLVRLGPGKRASDLVEALKAGGPAPAWAVVVGGPNGVDPGAVSLATTVSLAAGHYAALCMIPGHDGVPHAMKGMVRDLVVTPAQSNAALGPRDDATIRLYDYGYEPSSPITTRTRRVVVINDGKQAHELELAMLAPGKTPRDLAAWAERMAGPPPARFLGGVSPIAPGRENELSLALAPGHYVMLCFWPDAKDGKPHLAHGMARDFEVK